MLSDPLRSKSHVVVSRLGTLAAAAFGVAIIVAAIAGSHAADLVPGVIVLGIAAAGARSAGASVIADPAAPELVVRNAFRTTRIPWGEVRGFGTTDSWLTRGGAFQRRLIVADLKDGGRLVCSGVCAWSHAETQRLLGVLSDARAQARRGPARVAAS